MYRHDPLMRSLLSQFQTPTSPRRAVGFFRSGRLGESPRPCRSLSLLRTGSFYCANPFDRRREPP